MTDTSKQPLVKYKRRTYRLLFHGPTRFGVRAKLGFINSDKEFWVDADKVKGLPPVGTDESPERTDWTVDGKQRAAGETDDPWKEFCG